MSGSDTDAFLDDALFLWRAGKQSSDGVNGQLLARTSFTQVFLYELIRTMSEVQTEPILARQ